MIVCLSRLHFPVTALGPGNRAGIWFQGCSIRCRGCMAVDTWDVSPQQMIDLDHIEAWLDSLERDEVDGVTISGGEPFDQPEALAELLHWLREFYCEAVRDILVYSGYSLEKKAKWKESASVNRGTSATMRSSP